MVVSALGAWFMGDPGPLRALGSRVSDGDLGRLVQALQPELDRPTADPVGARKGRLAADPLGAADRLRNQGKPELANLLKDLMRHVSVCLEVETELLKGGPAPTADKMAEEGTWLPPPDPAACQGFAGERVEVLNSEYSGDFGRGVEHPWEPPIALGAFNPPPFPTDALPAWLRNKVEGVAISTQTPTDLAAILGICVCACVVAKKFIIGVRDDFQEPINVYGVIVLPSGERKSTVFSIMTDPIEKHEEELVQETGPKIAEDITAYKIKEHELSEVEKKAARAKAQDRSSIEARAKDLARDLAEMQRPHLPQLLADDVTPEKLAMLLAEQGGRMALMSAEGGVFDIISGRYSANNAPNLDVFLKGHSGDTLKVDRVGRQKQLVKKPALTMALTVQPEVIQGLLMKPTLRGRGLLARFMYSLPKSMLGRRKVDPPAMPPQFTRTYRESVVRLLRLGYGTDADGKQAPHILTLSPAAAERLLKFQAELEPRLGELGDLYRIRDWAGKLAGLVVRIAGIIHLASLVDELSPWETPISLQTLDAAVRIGQYLIPHARAALGMMGADPGVEQAKIILEWGKRLGVARFSRRDLWQGLRSHFEKAADLDSPLNLLIEHGYVRMERLPPSAGPGRKPSPTFLFNPIWVAQNSQNTQNSRRDPNSGDSGNSGKTGPGSTNEPAERPEEAPGSGTPREEGL